MITRLTRRELLDLGFRGSAGLAIGHFGRVGQVGRAPLAFQPSAFLRMDSAGGVTIWVNKVELGQGLLTSLPMIVADELALDIASVRVVQMPFNPSAGSFETRGSRSVRTMYEPLRRLGVSTRGLLVTAAAARWKAPISECMVRNASVVHTPTQRILPFRSLVAAAAKLPVPPEPVQTTRSGSGALIGKPVRKKDNPSKVDGSAKYPIDVRLPGMLYACVARSPVFGSKLASVDDSRARKTKVVKNVVRISSGVAVVAESTWAAIQGRDALAVTWEASPHAEESSIKLRARMDEASRLPGGSGPGAVPTGGKLVEAVYEVGFQPHAPMEPINCTARLANGRCEVWAATQDPAWAHAEIKRVTGLADSAIRINIVPGGGAFGRTINPDFIVEAVEVAKAAGVPVKVFRQREDDIQFDRYRPASLHRMAAAVDSSGKPAFWTHHIVTTPILEKSEQVDLERFEMAGAQPIPYIFSRYVVAHSQVESHVPRGCWRSTPHVANAFAVECMMDELAAAAGVNPLRLRLNALGAPRNLPSRDGALETDRLRRALELAAEKSGWGRPMPARQGRGIACHYSFGSYVASVAEVAVDGDGNVKIPRIVVAIDCGRVVNPDTVAAQMEGSVAFGLTAALKSKITIENGRVAESNFHNCPMLRIDEMPRVEVHIVPSAALPGGVGEPAVPVVAPALCNALFAATGVRIRALPLRTRLLRQR